MRYLLVHFRGEQDAGDEIYFSISRDGVQWEELNGGKAVLSCQRRHYRARNPLSVRDPGNNGLYILAIGQKEQQIPLTESSGRKECQKEKQGGSGQALFVWKSDDLVNWERKMVKISSMVVDAALVEDLDAVYQKDRQEFQVVWAQLREGEKVWEEISGPKEVIYDVYNVYTKDFRRFTKPLRLNSIVETVNTKKEYQAKRQGCVLPITDSEYERLQFFFGDAGQENL